ncbi:MAG: NnrU family protein [Methylocystis sp.]|nr:NnrU family protein [Methylocystis sp.]
MPTMIVGLALFLGVHSVRIFAEDWRTDVVARIGLTKWKVVYGAASLVGFALIVWGFASARQEPLAVWQPPAMLLPVAVALTLVSFILLAAFMVPRTQIKARLHHPMVLGVAVWAFAHLLVAKTLPDIVLFGSFLAWAVVDARATYARDRAANVVYPKGDLVPTLLAAAAGVVLWAAFAFWLHGFLIGVSPMADRL